VREPVRYVHNDYTSWSGRRRVTDHLEPEHAAERLRGRHAVINVWRPIGGPVEEAPLAVCDARSIAPRDLIPTDLVYPDRVGEVYSMTYNPGVNTAAGARDEGRLGAGAPLPSSSHDPPVRMPLSDDTPFAAAGGGKRVPRAGLVDAVEPVGRGLCEILEVLGVRTVERDREQQRRAVDGRKQRACPERRHRPRPLEVLRRAVAEHETSGARMALSVTYAELALAVARTGSAPEAAALAHRALARCEVGDCPGEVAAYRALALAAAPDWSRVLEYTDQAIARAAAKRSRREEGVSRLARAQALCAAGDRAAAATTALDVMGEFAAMQMQWHLAEARAIAGPSPG
jgi:hypothetical protein